MKIMMVAIACLFCVTVYLKDGNWTCYPEATHIATETGTYKIYEHYKILKSDKFVMTQDEVIAVVPVEMVKYITDECK